MTNLYKKTSKVLNGLRFLIVILLLGQPFAGSAQNIPVPEILYYKFDETGTTVTNHATNPPAGTETATLKGALTQGGAGQCNGALIGSGIVATTDYLETNWAPNLGSSSWTISFWTSNIPSSATLFYIFGDANTNSFRCFTNGVAGPNNWILRGGGLTDVYINGAATSAPSLTTFVYDAVANKVIGYYNGVQVTEVAQSAPNITGAGPFKVNGYAGNVGSALNALLDEFRFYSRALTATEVMSLYDRKSSATVHISTCVSPYTSPSGKYTWTASGIYKDTIQNSVCGDSAMTINLTINDNTTEVSGQPQNDTVNVGTQASFTITAIDASVYQWQVDMGSGFQDIIDDNLYSGAATATLAISNATSNMNGYIYRCIVTGNCSPVPSDNAQLQVTTTPAISFSPLSDKTYGDTDVELTATSNSNGAISYSSDNTSVATVSKNANDNKWYLHIIGAGTANIKASQESDGVYSEGSASTAQKVNVATLTITADAKTKAHGEADPALTYTVTGYQYNDNSSIIAGSLQRDAGENVGEYAINQNTLTAGDNYSIAYTGNKLTITMATPAISFGPLSNKTYGEADVELTTTSNSSGSISYSSDNANVATVSKNANDNKWYLHITGAGTANIKASQESDGVYSEGSASTVQNVNVAILTIAAEPKTKVYGQADPAFTYTASGYKYNDNSSIITGNLQRNAGENTGEYAINQNTLTAGNNYSIAYTGSKLTINKAAQSITWNQQLAAGCNGNGAIQMTATSNAGLIITYTSGNTAVATVTGNTLTPVQAGSSVITASQAGDENHLAATAVTSIFTYTKEGLVKQHFSDALYFSNEGGNYVQWQWYKNGTAVTGATSPYYSEMSPLNGSYYVSATDNNGNTINTCPLVLTGSTLSVRKISIAPNPLTTGAIANVSSNYTPVQLQGAKLILTDVTGNIIRQQANVTPLVKMQMPVNSGIYILTLILSNGSKETVNVVVR